jgi:hypothetical protein
MNRIYRPEWTYEVADFRTFLSYDLVSADPDITFASETVSPRLTELASIAREKLCLMYATELLAKDGYKFGGLEQMSRSVSKRWGHVVKAVEVIHRANTVYWALIQVA